MNEDYGDYNSGNNNIQNNSISRKHKIAAGVLAVFGFVVLIMWGLQLKTSINAPFAVYKNGNQTVASATSTCTGADCPENIARLKSQDTDKDGLSDYDELYVYETSPYLADSDSDGYNDYEEIKNGKDPNCPAGQICQSATATSEGNASSSAATASLVSSSSQPNLQLNSIDQNTAQTVLSGQMDAATLRKTLIEAGMDKTALDQVSDTDLMKAYQQTLSQ